MLEKYAYLIRFTEQQWQEDDDRSERACQGGYTHFLYRLQGGSCWVTRVAQAMSENTLGDYHGVIDEHAYGQHHAHHG